MSRVEKFLTAEEEQEIVQAIVDAEKNTSGEIRVHLEPHTKKDLLDRAKEVFHSLKMDNTKEENGVLIYVAVNDKKFAIYGDRGIDKVVPEDFWDTTRDTIASHFKDGRFKQGLIEGILNAGKELERHFPWQHGDVNELSNEISKN
ncbi:TPM domain-containing protein [Maribacter polysiphoniae]|uniref:TLP18.3/Psb32/MOLO-1 phosphatase superfamily protein n=1 Tax=Maribacter polysiphoniae TaxID=429344 RepID=A0A316DM91_9FLAO|nr:TPM domain-containing protein [Maribacter polysiphoniae]MBD1263072.1 TPM domain-containing protein [Maribacter polysiphoniae]PWK18836.1 TLP18.3/Psb32/MOLO-1 phosphatase superfamily protein [Maribacter polysiphoniae]